MEQMQFLPMGIVISLGEEMKRRIKKELISMIEQAVATKSFEGSTSTSMGRFVALYIEYYLSDRAYEPQPFECWVCPDCRKVCETFGRDDFAHPKGTYCKGRTIKMRQVEVSDDAV